MFQYFEIGIAQKAFKNWREKHDQTNPFNDDLKNTSRPRYRFSATKLDHLNHRRRRGDLLSVF